MSRILAFFLLFFISLEAVIIDFEEEKYISAIDNTFYKKGTLEFNKESIILKYNNSEKELVYNDDTLILKNGDESQKIDIENQLPLKMIFLLIESIHNNELENLEDFFTITKNRVILLEPKNILKSYIKKVEFKKDKTLEFITIFMSNNNKTTIRQIDE